MIAMITKTKKKERPFRPWALFPKPAILSVRFRSWMASQIILFAALFLILLHQPLEASQQIQSMIGQLSQQNYISYVGALESFGAATEGGYGTRYVNTPGNIAAGNFIYNEFSSFGLNVAYAPFSFDDPFTSQVESITSNNIVATLPGSTAPENVYIIGAHFDSISPDTSTAPGADDNATGVAAILEMASVLSQYQFASTIKFIAFNAEEQYALGSQAYTNAAKANNENIMAMLNFDMIGYTGGNPDEDLDLMGDPWLVDLLVGNAMQYTSLAVQTHYGVPYSGDHWYFGSGQYPGSSSALLIEDTDEEIWDGSNPYYHQTTDISGNLDYNFALGVTAVGAASMAGLAVVIPEPSTLVLLGTGLGLFLGLKPGRRG